MYQEHPIFIQPNDESIKVWRYIDFTKLLSLLDSKKLFFTRADKLSDPFEGSWPEKNIIKREDIPDNDSYRSSLKDSETQSKNWPRFLAINCWHINQYESVAMWKLFLKSDEGVAIQTTYKKLKESLIDSEHILLGKVNYIDYRNEKIEVDNNLYSPYVHKRKSFEYEQEVRAIITKWPITENKDFDFTQKLINDGVKIDVDMTMLVENIYISPYAPPWFEELVEAVVKKYAYTFNVIKSDLNDKPLF